jgi:hypothetical protein
LSLIVSFSSCRRDYDCECTKQFEISDISLKQTKSIKDAKRREAKDFCNTLQDSLGYDCELIPEQHKFLKFKIF